MAWLATDKDGAEYIYSSKPYRDNERECFYLSPLEDKVMLPKGSIGKLIGIDLVWENEPIEI